MLEISKKTNLLEQKIYKYELQDVEEPNLYRDIYDYDSVPKVAFNHRRVPMNMPEEIRITDTSFRDGQQSVEPYTVEQIVALYKLLSKLGGPYGIISQTEFFIYSKKDREAVEKSTILRWSRSRLRRVSCPDATLRISPARISTASSCRL